MAVKKILKSFGGNTFLISEYTTCFMQSTDVVVPANSAETLTLMNTAPLFSTLKRNERFLRIGIELSGEDEDALRKQLFQFLDPLHSATDPSPNAVGQLIVTEAGGVNEQYVNATMEKLTALANSANMIYVATFKISGDRKWRSVAEETDSWNITASGQKHTVSNNGENHAYPILTLTPTNDKSTDYSYKLWCPIYWRVDDIYTAYPFLLGEIDFEDKAQPDGDDIRVRINGIEDNRWLTYRVIEDCEDVWDETVDADIVVSLEGTDKKVGSYANKFTIAAAASAGDMATEAITSTDLSGFTKVYVWIKSTVNTSEGDLQLLLDDTASCASPLETLDIPALTANTWLRAELTLDDPSLLTAIISVGLKYTVDIGACVILLDDVRTGTKVWTNVNFLNDLPMTLRTGFLLGDTVDEVEINEDASLLPSEGIIQIDDETFTYTGIVVYGSYSVLTGITRAAKGTTAATHTVSTPVEWIQNEVWILYGNDAVSAPTIDDAYQPAFDLYLSNNTEWNYAGLFGSDAGTRPASWWPGVSIGSPTFYNGDHGTAADPWDEVGESHIGVGDAGGWITPVNPCAYIGFEVLSGESFRGGAAFSIYIISSPFATGLTGDVEATEAGAAGAAWDAWTSDCNPLTNLNMVLKVIIWLGQYNLDNAVEADQVLLTLDSTRTPVITLGAEQGNYLLDCTLENLDTGQSIAINMAMILNGDLEINVGDHTVVYLDDNSRQRQALTDVGGPRAIWISLAPGDNEFEFTDVGTSAITIQFDWEERGY